jgi:glucan phosphoethanolaminetransferase (alkaline phosphatase superfamily)
MLPMRNSLRRKEIHMLGVLARLSRSIPLLILLVVLAFVLYFVLKWRHSPTYAKEALIRVFTWICGVLSAFFILASLYALADGSQAVFELAASFAVVTILGLAITRICAWRFKKHHPNFSRKAERARTKKTHHNQPQSIDWLEILRKILNARAGK